MSVDATFLIPKPEFDRVHAAPLERFARLALLADMCRLNTLSAVKRAGSGHLGSSFSATDILVLLYHDLLNVRAVGIESRDRDIFLSSKGHDVPAQYAALHSLGILPDQKLLRLRRLHGLEGHPNVQVPGIEANTGSLGMGIAKGRGIRLAKQLAGLGGRVVVMTGDGELQEGQVFESLQTAAHHRADITVIVDHNKLQSDKPVSEIIDLGDLPAKVRAFGWTVERCDGHDLPALAAVLTRFLGEMAGPRMLIADTIKGRGVSFMEGPRALRDGGGVYRWHAGAPDDAAFAAAHREIADRVADRSARAGIAAPVVTSIPLEQRPSSVTSEYVVEAFGQRLVELGRQRPDLLVLDGDLAADCRLRGFEQAYPSRFIENGIAEQDMVSVAGALARHGWLPVVNSFATFLAARANEQIYNNVTEGSKVIYVCHFGGLIPAGPGPSHQSVRDISLFGALPGLTIVEPCNGSETAMVLDWCVHEAPGSCMVRLAIGPSPRTLVLPEGYRARPGHGVLLRPGRDVVVVGYGPVMLHEILSAAEALDARGLSPAVVNLPWLNRIDGGWLAELVAPFRAVVTVDDHSPVGGLGDAMLRALAAGDLLRTRRHWTVGCEEVPVCGAPGEVLAHHGLDAASLADRLLAMAQAVGVHVSDVRPVTIRDRVSADAPIG